ncbi:deleted in malignant brain tumors 1 protein-like [Pomacea canaliculata]|uniref:deleted in malignant brain tumors 1 protein-like n=1 Tax=Pomacea canaliculata TaxID=400727 RepID=UPI000D73586F|nr:deleted in malignant brain tumors 1 protein-like [Pomacea canaliculata]
MELYHTTTTASAVLCLLLTIAVSEPQRVRRDANASDTAVKGEELATQRGMLLALRLINEVGFHLDTFRDRVYGEVEQVKAQQVEILRGIADIQNRLKGGSGVPTIPSVPTTTPASNNSFIRLVNGSNPLEGRVEVLVGQVWGTVCDDYWDTKDAGVVCSMLGYSRGNAIAVSSAGFGSGSGPITFTGAQCEGNEVDLRHCPMNNSPFQGGCSHREDAGVICRPLN